MEESNSQGLEDAIARRLIKQVETDSVGVKPTLNSDTQVDGGGEPTQEISAPTSPDEFLLGAVTDIEVHDNETAIQVVDTSATPAAPEFAKVEKSLISLGFFTPSSRRIKNQKVKRISFIRQVDGKKVEASVEFHPSAMLGLPITADQDKFLALHDIITRLLQANGKISNPIRFTSAELLRLLNKRVRAGKNYKDISEWLDVMMTTTIFSNGVVYEAGKKQYAKDRFHVFERAVSVGKELPNGTIADANYVWLSAWQLENINQNWLLPIELATYRKLKYHIGKALVPLLQVWLFASHRNGRDRYEKRYDELCEMLSIQVYPALSQIRRQLKPSLDELVHYEYLKDWKIEKTSDGKAFKIVLFHGSKFHRDMRRRLNQKDQVESVVVAQYEPDLPEPGRLEPPEVTSEPAKVQTKDLDRAVTGSQLMEPVAPTPMPSVVLGSPEMPVGREVKEPEFNLIDELSARGLMPSVVVKLLASIPADRHDRVRDYIDYWDQAKNVEPGFLYDLIKTGGSLPSSFETRRERDKKLAAQEHRQKLQAIKEELTTAFEQYRETVIDRFIAEELTTIEFDRRVAVRLRTSPPQEGLWNRPDVLEQSARRAERKRIEEEMGTHRFMPYQDFCRREVPSILATLQLALSDFPELTTGRPQG
jgi:hypothetical protein